MTESPRLVAVGVSNGTTIEADVTTLGNAVKVVLTHDYTMLLPDSPWMLGFPIRPSFTGTAAVEYPGRIVASGSTLELLACEATALVNAGGATLT